MHVFRIFRFYREESENMDEIISGRELCFPAEKKPKQKVDKRIIKTKRELKRTLAELLKEKSFEQICVKEICERSSTSRITFYSHYKDKYDLLNSLFADFTERIRRSCTALSDYEKSRMGIVAFLKELLHGVVGCIFENSFLIDVIDSEKNSYLSFAFKCYITETINQVLELLSQKFECKYTSEEASAFVRGGVVSLFACAIKKNYSAAVLEERIGKLVEDLVLSQILFVHE